MIAAGGTSIFIRNDLLHRKLELNTDLQAVAVRVSSHKPVTICSLYVNDSININQLTELCKQLPTPFLLVGDFNAHNPLWGDVQDTDARGKTIEQLLGETNICILNDGSPTYLDPRTLKTSSIDLTLCSPDLASELKWSALEDTHGSDHFPILLHEEIPHASTPPSILNFKKANWSNFQTECTEKLNTKIDPTNKTLEFFTNTIMDIANNHIPRLSTKPRKNKSWFNEDCKKAVDIKKNKLRKAQKNPTFENITDFKIAQAQCRQTCRQAKRNSFKKYVSKINNKTPMSKIWKMIKKLKGTYKEPIQHIKTSDGSFLETSKEIADEIGKTISKNSSSENFSNKFQKHKANEEKKNIDFSTDFLEIYNKDFNIEEIISLISDLSDTAPGPDEVHNILIKQLPKESIQLLLEIFNQIWKEKYFPAAWRQATIIPIPKPGKNITDPTNYRPIALTSCLCKLMEKLVYKRLIWFLETKKKLSKYQCGFRKNRSTLDQLIRLETFIRNAFIRGEHVTVIFFDIEKAFDTTWKKGILQDLHKMGLRGNLPEFISNFLDHRSFQVKVGSELSDHFPQEEGVPQGSILSPILFEIKINSIIDNISKNTDKSLYVDDFMMAFASKNKIDHSERHLQLQLKKLETWADENGFKFSPTKTLAVHFCRKNSCVKQPELFLYGKKIAVKDEAKFLGVIFDNKLSFIPHIKDLKKNVNRP